MKHTLVDFVRAMIVASGDYGYYRMNNTAVKYAEKIGMSLDQAWSNPELTRLHPAYAEIVDVAESRPLSRIL